MRPACVEDERLLVGIVAFLNAYFKQMHTESASDPEDKDLRWILELLLNQVEIIYTFWTCRKVKPHDNSPVRLWLKGIVEKNKLVEVTVWYRCTVWTTAL